MRMIPPIPPDGATGSEKKIFSLLAQVSLGQGAYALSSLNLAKHDSQRWGEIDFVLVFDKGLLAIEVKGGVDPAGQLRTQHTDTAQEAFKKNKGSNILIHAHEYGLKANDELTGNTSIEKWKRALERGPVLAEGRYGLARIGWGMHVIVIVGVSATNKLAYYNPNMFAFFPHTKSKLTYFTVERCVELAEDPMYGGPFWQAA